MTTINTSALNPVKMTDIEKLFKAADTNTRAAGSDIVKKPDGKLSHDELQAYLTTQTEQRNSAQMMKGICHLFFGNMFDGLFDKSIEALNTTINTANTMDKYLNILQKDQTLEQANAWGLSLDDVKATAGFDGKTDDVSGKDITHLANENFVKEQYRTSLGREAEHAGLADWTKRLDDGTDRQAIADAIKASPEGQAYATNAKQTTFVKEQYKTLLGREAEDAGVGYWVSQLKAGKTEDEITAAIKASPERQTYFVKEQYKTLLGREAEDAGVEYWVSQLKAGKTEADITAAIKASPEYQQKHPTA